MRLFGWMQNKLTGKQDKKTSETTHGHAKQVAREEFSDWPQGLFSIGTFGNDDLKEITEGQSRVDPPENPSSSNGILDDITPEEVGKLQKALTKLLSRKPNKENAADLPLDRFLNCPSSLEVDRRLSSALIRSDSEDYREEDIDKTISVIIGRCKEVMSESEKNKKMAGIGKKSISILLKKMFACRSGFAPVPSLRDTLHESRMEKILRTMLHKTMSSQHSYRASSTKKYINEDKARPSNKDDDQENQHQISRDRNTPHSHDGSKWVKTDSDYIVLEI